jgi:hypothetical protein
MTGTNYCSRFWLGQSIAAGTVCDNLLQQAMDGHSIAVGIGWGSLLQLVLARTA